MLDSIIIVIELVQEYFVDLFFKQDSEGMGVCIFVECLGMFYVECCMVYSVVGEEDVVDIKLEFEGFSVFIDVESVFFFEDVVIDYVKDWMGGQLIFCVFKFKVF